MKKSIASILLLSFFVSTAHPISTGGKVAGTFLGSVALAGEGYLIWKKAERLSEIRHIIEARQWPGRVAGERHTWNYQKGHLAGDDYAQDMDAFGDFDEMFSSDEWFFGLKKKILSGLRSFDRRYKNIQDDITLYETFVEDAQRDIVLLENLRHELKGHRNFLVERFMSALNNTIYLPIGKHINATYTLVEDAEKHLQFMKLAVEHELRELFKA